MKAHDRKFIKRANWHNCYPISTQEDTPLSGSPEELAKIFEVVENPLDWDLSLDSPADYPGPEVSNGDT